MKRVQVVLDSYCDVFDYGSGMENDPVSIPRRYPRKDDAEVAGFIAAMFAYGRVTHFLRVVSAILERAGPRPADYFRSFGGGSGNDFGGIYYRLSRNDDVIAFLFSLGTVLRRYGTLENAFASGDSGSRDLKHAMKRFMDGFREADTSRVYGGPLKPRGLLHLLPTPAGGGSAKRLCLFLRWMARRGRPDLGIWKALHPKRLVIPLDTHIHRIARCLGLTSRRSPGWNTALEITEALRRFDSDDPLRYDFPLCHLGISGRCQARPGADLCGTCIFFSCVKSGSGGLKKIRNTA